MTFIGYARVSTKDQSLDLQLDALRAAGCTKIFEEKISGTQTDRPELKACMKYLREGDTLVVYKLDRLGRSLPHLLEVIRDLKAEGVGFKSVSDSIDTSTASGQLMFSVMGSFAEFERSLISERTIAGLESARARGRMGGRPRAVSEELGQKIVVMRGQRQTVASIAKELSMGEATVYRYLKTIASAEAPS